MTYPKTERQAELISLAGELADRFATRAEQHDRENSFPHENYAEMHQAGYLALTVPQEFGGKGASLLELALCQERLGRGDGATALGVGMHLLFIGRLAQLRDWPADRFEALCRAVVEEGALINAAATEAETGSPSRGGRPTTLARLTPDSYIISGRKIFTSVSPALRYFVVSATVDAGEQEEDKREVANFIVEHGTPGLKVIETWDTLGMRGTGSHDVVLEEVHVSLSARVEARNMGEMGSVAGRAWSALTTAAAYLGVATAARDFAIEFAKNRRPNSLNKSIAELPHIQARIGDMELALLAAREMLFGAAEEWSDNPDTRTTLAPRIAAGKYFATNNAVSVVDLAMRIVGGVAIFRRYPLERYYRDVRAGLNHPPLDDSTLTIMAQAALGQQAQMR